MRRNIRRTETKLTLDATDVGIIYDALLRLDASSDHRWEVERLATLIARFSNAADRLGREG